MSIGRAERLPLGRRVAYWRSRRGMSQRVFADRLGKSKSWVDKIERGQRRLDRFSVLQEIADVLDVDVHLLLGRAPTRRHGGAPGADQTTVEQIRAALTCHEGLGRRPAGVPDPDRLERAVTHAWISLTRGDYDRLLRDLPTLIRHAQWSRADRRADQGIAALLTQAYQITADLLHRVGDHHLAWLAADRATIISADTGDPLQTGRAVISLADVVRATGRPGHAIELATTTARRLSHPSARCDEPARLSIVGTLLLQAALGAAAATDVATATTMLNHAQQAADHVGPGRDHYHTSFGPALVGITRTTVAVELGRGQAALAEHHTLTRLPDYQRLPPAVRAAHLVQVARAQLQVGTPGTAASVLLEATRTAPAEIRVRPLARHTLATILRRLDQPSPITHLAETIGVSV